MQFLVGTSGYSYPQWKGSFYPEKLPQREMLAFYAERFGAVEINNSFYRMPDEEDLRSWAGQVPATFQFALKAPQLITHFRRLKDAEEPTAHLVKGSAVLKKRAGPLLFGLPPNLKRDLPRLQAFLQLIPTRVRTAFEFRHPSWFDDEVCDCLRKRNSALCIAHTDDSPSPYMASTADWGYVRLRRERYTKKDLAGWLQELRGLAWKQCYVFFKHEDTGTGPKFAQQFLKLLEADSSS